MIGKFFVMNALRLSVSLMETGINAQCPLCGETPVIKGLMKGDVPEALL
ncbi:MAG TPA: hypothetical protein VGJ94_08125 [Syntrophorhabdaceae bacterium]|jgi:uncharacterized protein (DUF983 family)